MTDSTEECTKMSVNKNADCDKHTAGIDQFPELGHVFRAHSDMIDAKLFQYKTATREWLIEYTRIPYDMIDDDLDYDEEHYLHVLGTFERTIEELLTDKIVKDSISGFTLDKYYRVFNGNDILTQKLRKCRTEDKLEKQVTTYSKLC